ncbi:MAG: hypothetical protein FWF24_00430 [Alphaproteobacteria bacterium]|nr:hypothetical protein [Alphaproteobacteria bacterium]
MNEKIKELSVLIQQLQERMEEEFQKSRAYYHVKLHGKIASFAEDIIALHKQNRIKWSTFFKQAKLGHVITAPVIYSMIVPLVFLDFFVTLYQHICFRVYNIPLVKRTTFMDIDRHHLAYLNAVEKLNCLYCSYGNGVLAYAREIAARTEQFWCPVKHATRVRDPHHYYMKFLSYGDAQGYQQGLEQLRKDAQNLEDPAFVTEERNDP